ncbi:thermonuclease family protein [Ensifer aridi]|uniref:thermonuclease family protein n=1 Tax=Ensifer aridi TaxID=1708715 RepID=UPI00358F304C
MKFVPLLFLAGALAIALPARSAGPIIGRATVVDGDTLEIRGERIRLNGVDAPESWQTCGDGDGGTYRCGKEAAFALDRFLAASRPTRCEIAERDRYHRFVAVCFRADGREVNRWLVESGNAVDWARYSKGAYAGAQELARARGDGVWRATFDLPCQARAKHAKHESSC